ncbi:lipid IV(A) 4-amino-4-deoxy-L-arabinosyltransferase [Pseudomonas sp. CCI3.2]|uniref:lipid IV(A) 4-amino-4-deoxy-L-arabinosyltransferase n=1 Tax=unclassified Pseudomonas TaxID=196821 RepID=UPI002AC98278|nr:MULTISPECIES: lipid IV(A) 4-amino-4-deoxy-L-arabinosyltransferase [unclassified Pseudomonas]MEB0077072.1 lipid IV(A) 4-amino-4-deoxy-L-arabinosyltransferase [Pseudomonas sp. MH10out]MEB0089874.1 lipid IV(A) 4-amino-4-deoxy-L-arabinosyltransferase [Pseudomonas sp. CCI4.2]MEB0104203.1 lipid IV(A) 4-amino-4-deoxy-L-arabinosyltransferase [Pseudomonas sp. CCI3.2]MEB0129163.1 lipid IV(A) 4-amino-4-deoxy-L-arabinosyltransferase [Pseudomonas sp. CCI2.4]MEB0156310.1 lipid IV(A) 4-amino-4-deoxy-L-ara
MTGRWALLFLLVAFFLAFLLPLGSHGLWIPDESRYAQVSQEMLLSGNWVSPHFMGLRYFEKPVGGYWMIAVGQAIFGENLFGVRIASALSVGLSALLIYAVARRMWNDPRKSFMCALIFLSFGLIAAQAGYANLDPQFTLWVNLSLAGVWFAVNSAGRERIAAWMLVGFACGMGFMTKGFLAWLLPALIAVPYMVWQKRFRELLRFGPLAVVVALVVCLPWALAVQQREPDFWNFFFWHEHIRRFAGADAPHPQAWWFYLPVLVMASLPWAAMLPATFKQAWQSRTHPNTVFVLLWLLLPLAFLSLSRGKLPTYVMPCMLPLALLMGPAVVDRLASPRFQALRLNGLLNIAIGVIVLIALAYMQYSKPIYENEPLHLTLALVAVVGWTVANLFQVVRPLTLWLMPALGAWLFVALIPMSLPNSMVFNKTPDRFIARHATALSQSKSLLSNDLGAASALSWRIQRPDVALYNTVGEVKYGLTYADSVARKVDVANVQQWMSVARSEGQVGVVMRVNSQEDRDEVNLLPKDGQRYEEGNIVILIFAQSAS